MIKEAAMLGLIFVMTGVPAEVPDFFMKNIVHRQYDQKGLLQNTFLASKITHYSSQQLMYYSKPILTIYHKEQILWRISALNGISDDNLKKLHFKNKVIIYHPAREHYPETTMATSEMTWLPKESLAETHTTVTVTQGTFTIQSQGMRVHLK